MSTLGVMEGAPGLDLVSVGAGLVALCQARAAMAMTREHDVSLTYMEARSRRCQEPTLSAALTQLASVRGTLRTRRETKHSNL